MLSLFRFRPAVVLVVLSLSGCRHVPTEKEIQGAQIHFDLGIQAQQAGDVQSAYKEFQAAQELDPGFADAYNASGILLHLAFKRPEEAVAQYKHSLEIRPTFSEAKTNLANVYLDQARYDEAILLYQDALNDMLYTTPYIAQANLGWALYKRGDLKRDDIRKGIESIKAAVTINPKFCLGYKNLGLIYDEQGNPQNACKNFTRYRESCPEVADAYYREGVCLAKQGDNGGAKRAFAGCQTRTSNVALKDDCGRLLEHLQ